MREFDITAIRSSVKELAAKTKEKKRLRREALTLWRALRPKPYGKGYAETSESKQALQTFEERHQKARERGSCARYWGLCLAIARDRPYRQVEQRTNQGALPDCDTITDLLLQVAITPIPEFAKEAARQILRDQVRRWLGIEVPAIAFRTIYFADLPLQA